MTDQAGARPRTNSLALRSVHMRGKSRQVVQPKSTHTSDPFLQEFLSPTFDPAAFLNAQLPPVSRRAEPGDASSLGELSNQAQTLLSQVNTQTTRLSNTLTELTDDILRSGSRLAYQVELLRGDTLALTEVLTETLQSEIECFVPEGLENAQVTKGTAAATNPGVKDESAPSPATPVPPPSSGPEQPAGDTNNYPEYIQKLKTLTLVRSRLDEVIKTFGDAMEFVLPPSEVSVSASFLSVSAPEPGSEQQSSEEKGQRVLKALRTEIADLLSKTADPVEGIAKAASRVEELKDLTRVWKGTAEEKGRTKFIDSLAKMVEDRHRELTREMEQATRREAGHRPQRSSLHGASVSIDEGRGLPGGFGLLSQLQKLRSGL